MNKFFVFFLISILYCGMSSCQKKQDRANEEISTNDKPKSLSNVDSLANALKNKILNSETNVQATGIAYYVSNKGSDLNSGMSPQEAWATLSKISEMELNNGDVVYFERGGIWRGSLIAKEGVCYSAYGRGDKPKIFGSPQNYSIKNKWKKSKVNNVYVYDEVLEKDAGVLVFNEGQAHSVKKVIGIDNFKGTINELKNDLDMYHDVNDKKIYLYSDNGNPADRYSSIEFCLKDHIIKTRGDNIWIDNLCIKYGGAHGIGSGAMNGLKVTNCELGWIGGSIQHDDTRYGNAIEIWGSCSDFSVDHCYIYQVYDAAVTHQYKNEVSSDPCIMENVTYSNNLIEYCTYSIEYFLDQPNSPSDLMKNILFKNNICRFSGYGWGWQRPNKIAMHIQGWRHMNPAENFQIKDNIFDRSKYFLIFIGVKEQKDLPVMINNTFVQGKGGEFGVFGENQITFDSNIREVLIEKGIDKNPNIIFVE